MGTLRRTAAYLAKLADTDYGVSTTISGAVNYLVDSYFAKVDVRNAAAPPMPWRPADPDAHIKEMWLGCDLHKARTVNKSLPDFARALHAWAFWQMFASADSRYEIVPFLDTYEFKEMLQGSYYYRIQSEQIQVALGKTVTLPVFGQFFVQSKNDGKRLLITLDLGHDSPGCSIRAMTSPENEGLCEAFFADFQLSSQANDIYYRQCLSFVRGRLDFMGVKPTAWSSIIMKEDLKDKIRQNTVEVLENSEKFMKLGMCPSQNLMLISPPGMAKTTIFRAISCDTDQKMTRIWCTGKSIDRADHVTALFEAARSLAPCIVFIEDMDLFGHDRSQNMYGQDNHVLNEFLACLDGAQENAGVVVMASTNDVASMDEALVNRPGRFDVKIEMALPDAAERSTMLRTFLRGFHATPDASVSVETWKNIIQMTDGLTGDYVKSLAKSTVIRAVASGRADAGDSCIFSADDLTAAAEQAMRNYQIGKRAKKHHTYEVEDKS